MIVFLLMYLVIDCGSQKEITYGTCVTGSNKDQEIETYRIGTIELFKFSTNKTGFMIDSLRIVGGIDSLISKIVYPEIAKNAGVEGYLTAEFIVDSIGNATNIHITKEIGAGCEEAVLNALRKQKFVYMPSKGNLNNETFKISIKFKVSTPYYKN